MGPEKVSKLVFLDAFWLQNGESIFSHVANINKGTIESGHSDNRKYESDYLIFSEDGRFVSVDKERMVEVFYHDSPLEDHNRLNGQEFWQPVSVLATPVNVTDNRYGAIPKFYIICTESFMSFAPNPEILIGAVYCHAFLVKKFTPYQAATPPSFQCLRNCLTYF